MAVKFTGAAERLTDDDVERAAELVGCDQAAMWAVVEVESSGRGFYADGSLKALFEPHVFYKQLAGTKLQRAIAGGLAYKKWGTKKYPSNSYERIRAAVKIDETAALMSTSWGMGQLMGFNCKLAGYATPQEMVAAFIESEGEQLIGMARFIKARRLHTFLKAKQWAKFAAGYNGPAYAENRYDAKLAAAFRKHSKPAIVGIAALQDDEDGDELEHRGVMPDSGGDDDLEETKEDTVTAAAADPMVAEAVQRRLCEMGYFDVGQIDGKPGGKTFGAVAAFMTDRTGGEVKDGELTEAAVAEIATAHAEGFHRPITSARSNATLQEIAKQVPAVKELVTTENVLKVGKAGVTAVAGSTALAKATGTSDSIWSAFQGVSPITWVVGGLALLAILVWGFSFFNQRARDKAATDYRIGKRA